MLCHQQKCISTKEKDTLGQIQYTQKKKNKIIKCKKKEENKKDTLEIKRKFIHSFIAVAFATDDDGDDG